MHFPPYENNNKAIVDVGNENVPNNYFNIIKLSRGERFKSQILGYETCIVPATGTIDIEVEGLNFESIGNRVTDVWFQPLAR